VTQVPVVVQFLKVAACSTGLARSAAVVAYIMIAHGLQWADAANLHPETKQGLGAGVTAMGLAGY
jgi:hypothetical protein